MHKEPQLFFVKDNPYQKEGFMAKNDLMRRVELNKAIILDKKGIT